mmetsp:Transcript_28366/g.33597  ORF Transcript_28366/g.33597 Transcript_28366/m.33597 type:complete len:215 (+) Transcript_28366:89-733(+)
MMMKIVFLLITLSFVQADDKQSQWASSVENAKARLTSGHILLKKGKTDLAHKLFKDAVKFNPVANDCWSSLGEVQVKLGLLQEATESLDRAIALSPPNKPLPSNVKRLDTIMNDIKETSTSPVEKSSTEETCDIEEKYALKVDSIIQSLKSGKRLSKDNKNWASILRTSFHELNDAGFDWESSMSNSKSSSTSPKSTQKKNSKKPPKVGNLGGF